MDPGAATEPGLAYWGASVEMIGSSRFDMFQSPDENLSTASRIRIQMAHSPVVFASAFTSPIICMKASLSWSDCTVT